MFFLFIAKHKLVKKCVCLGVPCLATHARPPETILGACGNQHRLCRRAAWFTLPITARWLDLAIASLGGVIQDVSHPKQVGRVLML